MTRKLAAAIVAVGVIGVVAGAYALWPAGTERLQFQGWVEANLVFISPDEMGRVETLSVREGDAVDTGAALFKLDADLQRAAVAENEAAVVNAQHAYERAKVLLKSSVGSQKTFDDAEAALRTAEARLNSAKVRLERRSIKSPASGVVQEVYFRVGEQVQPGRPIVSLLPPGNVRVRFFVPQAVLPKVQIGDRVAVSCDGCPEDPAARISFISAQAEFTPPVIYSQDERSRLVFRVEGMPEHPENLRVGQPVSVVLKGAGGVSHARK